MHKLILAMSLLLGITSPSLAASTTDSNIVNHYGPYTLTEVIQNTDGACIISRKVSNDTFTVIFGSIGGKHSTTVAISNNTWKLDSNKNEQDAKVIVTGQDGSVTPLIAKYVVVNPTTISINNPEIIATLKTDKLSMISVAFDKNMVTVPISDLPVLQIPTVTCLGDLDNAGQSAPQLHKAFSFGSYPDVVTSV